MLVDLHRLLAWPVRVLWGLTEKTVAKALTEGTGKDPDSPLPVITQSKKNVCQKMKLSDLPDRMCLFADKMVVLGEVFPNFEAESTEGRIRFHDFIRGS